MWPPAPPLAAASSTPLRSERRLAAPFPPLTRSLLRCSSIFAAGYDTPPLFHFLFPNHVVNSAHLFCLFLFYSFQEFCVRPILTPPHPPPQRSCASPTLIQVGFRPPSAPSTLWSCLSSFSIHFSLLTLPAAWERVLSTAYWSFGRDEQNWKLNTFIARSASCCQQTVLCLAGSPSGDESHGSTKHCQRDTSSLPVRSPQLSNWQRTRQVSSENAIWSEVWKSI